MLNGNAVGDAGGAGLKPRQVFQGQFAILHSRRNDDGARGHTAAAVDLDRVRFTVADEPLGASRNDHLRAELLRRQVRVVS